MSTRTTTFSLQFQRDGMWWVFASHFDLTKLEQRVADRFMDEDDAEAQDVRKCELKLIRQERTTKVEQCELPAKIQRLGREKR